MRMRSDAINYSQCWEDAEAVKAALQSSIRDRKVVSVSSGGDNTLALLALAPERMDAVDLNHAQNHLLSLKFAAAKALSYDDYLAFLGVRPTKARLKLFESVAPHLADDARRWWAAHASFIRGGVINQGRFERFTRAFARLMLPIVIGKRRIEALLASEDAGAQRALYEREWNGPVWRAAFGFAASKLMLRRFARQHGMFAHAKGSVSREYLARLENHLARVPARHNFYLRYSLSGRYGEDLPPYLSRAGYDALRAIDGGALRAVSADLLSHLKSLPAESVSAFNLSDIFEALTEAESSEVWREVARTAIPGARAVYFVNLVERRPPAELAGVVTEEAELSRELGSRDRVFFYARVGVCTVNP